MINPYSNVNWNNEQIKSFSHMHVFRQDYFDFAVKDGYRHFATSHYRPSDPYYPLKDFFKNIPDNILGSPNSEKVKSTDCYDHFNAIGSLAKGFGQKTEAVYTWKGLFDYILNDLQFPDAGGISLNHPDDFNLERRILQLDYDERVLGIEIYNRGSAVDFENKYKYGTENDYLSKSLKFWDDILKTGRRCWCFCVVDWPVPGYEPWYGSNILIPDNFTEYDCLKAYRQGKFYGQLMDLGLRFTKIKNNNSELIVEVNKPSNIKFISNISSKIIKNTMSASYIIPNNAVYTRIEAIDIENEHSHIFSNPIMLKTKNDIYIENNNKKKIIIL